MAVQVMNTPKYIVRSQFLEREEQLELQKKLALENEAFLKSYGMKPLEVFRMETPAPAPQDESTFGKFHQGDPYVIKHEAFRQLKTEIDNMIEIIPLVDAPAKPPIRDRHW